MGAQPGLFFLMEGGEVLHVLRRVFVVDLWEFSVLPFFGVKEALQPRYRAHPCAKRFAEQRDDDCDDDKQNQWVQHHFSSAYHGFQYADRAYGGNGVHS